MPKPVKNNTRKVNYRPISFMKIEEKFLRKILANSISVFKKG